MTKRIFRSILGVAITVLLASLIIATSFLYTYFNRAQVGQLKDELSLISSVVEKVGVEYLYGFESSTFRFTLISHNGTVIYDTKIDASLMESHLDREEVKEALEQGYGGSSRYSSTLTEKTLYESVKLQDGNVLRVSISSLTVAALIFGMLLPITAIVILAISVSLILARSMAKRITEPLNNLDLENPGETEIYEELQPILSKISRQHIIIGEQENFAERSRREFTANVSHELKTPLQSIIGSAELLQNELVKPEDVPRFVGHIKDEAERLVTLINDIIRLSQLDEDSKPVTESVDLKEVAEEVVGVLESSADKKNVTFELLGENCTINGVRRYIYEIIYNLCDNAVRYNVENGRVTVCVERQDANVVLSVADTGIGIAPEHHSRIFERFYRVDKSHSKETGGTGLGLSIVKHAVQFHGGKLEIESAEGKGTTVRIIF